MINKTVKWNLPYHLGEIGYPFEHWGEKETLFATLGKKERFWDNLNACNDKLCIGVYVG
jgi:hypothetical protein